MAESSYSRRPVLGTSQGRNPTTPITTAFNQFSGPGNHRKSYDGGLNHNIYLDAIVNDWSGEPEELFKRKNWRKWVKTEANRRNNDGKYLNKVILNNFATTLMDLLFDENRPHIDQICKKFNEQQKARFQTLKQKYDDQDSLALLRQINGEAQPGTGSSWDPHSGDDDSGNEDEGETETMAKTGVGWRSTDVRTEDDDFKRKPTKPCPDSPDCFEKSDEEGYGGLFQDPYNDLGHKTSNEPPEKPKIPKRIVEDGDEVTTRKKPRTVQREGYQKLTLPPLSLKRTPIPNGSRKIEASRFYNASSQAAASSKYSSCTSNGGRLDENGIKNALKKSPKNDVKERTRLHENYNPPYSPRSEATKLGQAKGNVEPQRKIFQKSISIRRADPTTPPFRSKINSVIDKCSGYQGGRSAEKENSISQRRLFGSNPKTQFRSEPLTQSTSNKAAIEEVWEDELPGNQIVVDESEKENFPVTAEEIILKYPKPSSAPALTLEMFEEIKNALERLPKDKLVSGFSLNIHQEDLAILNKNTEWLIDLNIDFYLELIKERSKQEGYPSVYIFHSYFYTLLTGTEGYNAVADTTEKDDIFQFDLLLIPVHLNQHWRLVVVKVQEKSIECYDSMDHTNRGVMNKIEEFLLRWEHLHAQQKEDEQSHSQDSTSTEVLGETEENGDIGDGDKTITVCDTNKEFILEDAIANSPWTKFNKPSDTIPQQTNAIDCGIFVLQYAEYLSRQMDFDFSQSHIPYFRKRITYETLTKTLLT